MHLIPTTYKYKRSMWLLFKLFLDNLCQFGNTIIGSMASSYMLFLLVSFLFIGQSLTVLAIAYNKGNKFSFSLTICIYV